MCLNQKTEMVGKAMTTYISEKINKIRWKPEVMDDAEYFVTGSVDEEANSLSLWYYPANDEYLDNVPVKKMTLAYDGDVTALEFLDTANAVCSSSKGSVQLIKCSHDEITVEHSWENLHQCKTGDLGVCTGLSCFDGDIVSIGEGGRIVLLSVGQKDTVRIIDEADSCPLMCVAFLKHNELVTGNFRGQLKIWDLRVEENEPMSVFMSSNECGATMCVAHHPTQRHILLAGGHEGPLTVWDLRKSTYPISVLNAHKGPVSEIQFHPERPDNLFTCSWSGDLWQWSSNRNSRELGEEVPWLISDSVKHRMEVASLMTTKSKPINSLDVNRTRIICGGDSEAVYLCNNLLL